MEVLVGDTYRRNFLQVTLIGTGVAGKAEAETRQSVKKSKKVEDAEERMARSSPSYDR